MKVLFYSFMSFAWAHGGQQIQIEQTREALEKRGISTEFLRWWDDQQSGDVLHFFGRMPPYLVGIAQQRGMRVVVADLLGAQGARPAWRLRLQTLAMRNLERMAPHGLRAVMSWRCYRLADACVALTPWEKRLLVEVFGVPPERVTVVPNGVEEAFLQRPQVAREDWLVSVATITDVKRNLELARAAIQAQTPVRFIGRPYSESDPYGQQFLRLAKANPRLIRYEGPIADRAELVQVYSTARGFVLLSKWESLSLSALEAAACGCPLLLSDLPWARTTFGAHADYCSAAASVSQTADALRRFHQRAPGLPRPPKPLNWQEVADQLAQLYRSLLDRPK